MKRIITILLVLAIGIAAQAQSKERPTVAVVLSGGGAKGVAHIEALRAVEAAGIPIDIICGTSMGSLIGALYCVGYSTDFLDSLVRSQDWAFLLSDRTDPSTLTLQQRREQNTYALIRGLSSERPQQGGLIRGRNLMRLFRQLCDGYLDSISFDSLPIRFACVATDLVTNTEVDFRSGYLTQAMRASMAIPGVFTPVRMGDSVLVDGGLRNNYPADLARRMGADVIIGMSVQDEPMTADDIKDATSVLSQIIDNNCKNKLDENIAMSDVFMRVDVSGYSAASFTTTAIDSLLSRGAAEAQRHRDELLILSARIAYTPEYLTGRRNTMPDDSLQAVAKRRHRTSPDAGNLSAIPIASVGFRYDSEEAGVVQLNLKVPLRTSIPMGISGTLRLGRQMKAGLQYTLLPRGFTSPTVSYTYSRHDLDIYTSGQRTYNVKYRQQTADISPFNFRFRNFTFNGGLQWDYYNYYGRLLTASTDDIDLNDEHYFSYHFAADLNTEDNWYFPQHGTRVHLGAAYRTNNLVGIGDHAGLTDLAAHWRINIAASQRLTIQPMLYGRLLIGDNVPAAYLNAIGSEWFGHNIDQQMPFAGVGRVEYVERNFAAIQLQMQYRLLKNHYIVLRVAAATHNNTVLELVQLPNILGAQIGYSYNTIFGPIDIRLGYSDHTKYPYLYFNIGHCF